MSFGLSLAEGCLLVGTGLRRDQVPVDEVV